MKKLLVFLCAMSLVFGVVGIAGATTYYEEYSGYQDVWQSESYNFGFDFWYTNDVFNVGTNSNLELTQDAEGALDPWASAMLYIDFHSTDLVDENATITLTAWDGSGNPSNSFVLDVVNFSGWQFWIFGDPDFEYSYELTPGQVNAFEEWGWGSVNIAAEWESCWFPNDFAITRVAMEVEPVPEPATMLLLGSGLIGLAGLGRKKFFKRG